MSRRTSGAGGSARGKPTDLTAKKGNTQRGLESQHTEGRPAVKTGRNMGGRDLMGDRVRKKQGPSGS